MITQLLSPRLVEALGFTLLHALWQGAIFALALAVLLVALRRYSPQARYLVSIGLLAAFALASVVTFGRLYAEGPAALIPPAEDPAAQGPAALLTPAALSPPAEGPATLRPPADLASHETESIFHRFGDYYERHLPLLVTLWLLGVLVMQLRWLGQLAYVQRLKHYGNQVLPEAWRERLAALEAKLRIRKPVAYALSPRIDSPMVIGWLKPVVLLPREMFHRLTDTEIYAVLAHELAHVRRDDFAINLLQSILTNVFFFHPGVWWMSSRADEEREQACDDLAVQALGGALPYAKTLVTVGSLSLKPDTAAQPALAMAFRGQPRHKQRASGFAARVKRLFGTQSGTGSFQEGFATACILFGALFVAGFASSQTARGSDQNEGSWAGAAVFGDSRESTSDTLAEPNDYDFGDGPDAERSDESLIRSSVVAALNATIVSGDEALFEVLLAELEDVDARDLEGYTPLAAAAHTNEVGMTKSLLARGAKVEGQSREGWSALTEAADEGAFEVVKVLIEAGAEVNATYSPNGASPLIIAAANDHADIVRLLITAGADVNGFGGSPTSKTPGLRPPLHAAAIEGHTEILRYLLDGGADVDLQDSNGRTALMKAAAEGQGDAVALLLSRRADAKVRDGSGRRASDFAARDGHYQLAQRLALVDGSGGAPAARGAQPQNQRQDQGQLVNDALYEALFQAVDDGDLLTISSILLQRGIDVDHGPESGITPLMHAVREGQTQAMELLLDRGADVNAKTADGWTALLFAAQEHRDAIAQRLLAAGANANVQVEYKASKVRNGKTTSACHFVGATALLVATEMEAVAVAAVLLEAGADPNQALRRQHWLQDGKRLRPESNSPEPWTPYREALATGNAELIALYRRYGAR